MRKLEDLDATEASYTGKLEDLAAFDNSTLAVEIKPRRPMTLMTRSNKHEKTRGS